MAKRTKKQAKSRLLKVEALEQRQLLAGGFTSAQGQEFSDIVHPNGNVYDQVLLKSSSINITNDPGQITRVSFLDLQGDIVQVEFGGSGTLSISLDASTFKSGVAPTNYNQSGITYVQGLASITISGSDATTNLNVFSVGSATAVNQALFDSTHTGGNNLSDIQRVTVVANPANPNGSTFGSIFAGNVNFTGSTGPVGITAANVQVQGVVNVGDVNATGSAIPTLVFGTASQFGSLNITGGDLISPNGAPINNNGSYLYTINLTAGTLSNGTADAAENTYSQLSFTGQNPVTATTKVFTLTTGVDSIVGTSGNDQINAQLGGGSTLTALDTIDGAGGNDTLSINDVTGGLALPGGLTVKNVETINLASAGAATIDTSTSGITGLTALNVLSSTGTDVVTAGTGQAVTVFNNSGVSGVTSVTLTGGTTQNVTTKGGVAISGGTGAITVTDTNQGFGGTGGVPSTITGGTSVSLTNSVDATGGAPNTITIGGAGSLAPTGAVTVTDTITGDKAVTRASGLITVNGGTTVSVTESATQAVQGATGANFTITQAPVTVNGTSATTSVTVSESAAVTAVTGVAAVTAVAGTTEKTDVKFQAAAAGTTVTVAGLIYTAPAGGSTATQVATAFANLASDRLGTGFVGLYTSGGVTGASSDTVTFTAVKADFNETDITAANVVSLTKTDGVAGTAAVAATTGKGGVALGAVTIVDTVGAGGGTITTANLTNTGGATITSGALSTVSLTGAAGAALTINNTAAKTLDLTVNGVTGGTNVSNGTYTTVNVHTTTADSTLANITDAALTTLNVDGTKKLTLTTAAGAGALTTVNVSGSASLTTANLAGTVTAINASGTSGAVSVGSIVGTNTSFAGGSGNDSVTTTANPSKSFDGGGGTDTITLNFAGGAAANSNVKNFETLLLGTLADNGGSYDAAGFTTFGSGATANTITFANAASGSTLQLSAAQGWATTVNITGAASSTTDALNVSLTAGATFNNVVAPNVETISVSNTGGTSTLPLAATSATTVNVTGSKDLILTNVGGANNALTLVDGSALTGKLFYTTNGGTTAETVKGGTKDDVLATSAANATLAETLNGGAGNDTLLGNAGLSVLTGGAGNDTFVVRSTAPANVNIYNTTDAGSGDRIQLIDKGTEVFAPAKISLGSGTAVFQDFANAVVAASVTAGVDGSMNGYIGWFQFNGDTYVVEVLHNGAMNASFANGTDVVVKISGLVDLSTAFMTTAAAQTTNGIVVSAAGGEPIIVIR